MFKRTLKISGATALLLALAAIGYVGWQLWISDNFHTVVSGRVFRSGQPSPQTMARWVQDHQLATVVNLRDDAGHESFVQERIAVEGAGARFVHIPMSDRTLPKRSRVLELIESLETAPRPLLLHCRAGADRAGVASVLAAMAAGESFAGARSQLGLRYLHTATELDSVEGLILKYESFVARHGGGTGGWNEFREWVQRHYSHEFYMLDISVDEPIVATAGELCHVKLTVRNLTDVPIPHDDPARVFRFSAYTGSAVDLVVDSEFGPRTPLSQTIGAETTIEVIKEFWPPKQPGTYSVSFDLIEEYVTWFVAQGSPERTWEMIVRAPEAEGTH